MRASFPPIVGLLTVIILSGMGVFTVGVNPWVGGGLIFLALVRAYKLRGQWAHQAELERLRALERSLAEEERKLSQKT